MEKNVLVTAFEPFGGEDVNASLAAVAALPDRIGSAVIRKATLPVVFGEATRLALEAAEAAGAELILCIGQAAGRAAVTPEAVAINLQYASIPDNVGNAPKDQPCIPEGDAAYFATVPVRRMAEAIRETGCPAAVSLSAGAYVCNDLLYGLLHRLQGSRCRVGFIHVPVTPAQTEEGRPSLETEKAVIALTAAIEAALEE